MSFLLHLAAFAFMTSSPPAALPEGFGLSARYPKDAGIAKHPHVLFTENFEEGTVPGISRHWTEVSNKGGKVVSVSDDVPPASGGKHSIQLAALVPQNTGGHLYVRLPKGVDRLFARFYVKFPEDAGYIHHFVHMGGYNPPTNWPQGGAGDRPSGDERMTVGIEPTGDHGAYRPPGVWNFYPYWHEMKVSADGRYWGNGILPAKPALIPKNRWQCVEVMMQANSSPEEADGELALWLDGKLVTRVAKGVPRGPWTGMGFKQVETGGEPFEGFRWRKTNDLKINFFWLLHYVTDLPSRQNGVPAPARPNRVWFDDIVLSTEYVGPIKP